MKPIRAIICWLLIAAQSWAGITYTGTPGQTVYVRVNVNATTSVAAALTEGTSQGVGFYTISDANLVSAGVSSAGTYTFKVFSGTPSTTAADTLLATGVLPWSGIAELGLPYNLGLMVGPISATNSAGGALTLVSSGGNGNALTLVGNGSGHGIYAFGGATGDGANFNRGGSSNDDFKLANSDAPTLANVIWNALKASHTTADSFGDYLDDEISSVSGGIADLIWDEPTVGHATAGTFGVAFSDPATLDELYDASTEMKGDIQAGGSAGTAVDNAEVVEAFVSKMGTRADGTVVIAKPARIIAGEDAVWWIDCSAVTGKYLWLYAADNEVIDVEGELAISSVGINRELVVVHLDGSDAVAGSTYEVTIDVSPRQGRTIKAILTVIVAED